MWQSANNDTHLWLAPVLLICISIIIFTCYFVVTFWKLVWAFLEQIFLNKCYCCCFHCTEGTSWCVWEREAERRWKSAYKILLAWLIFYTLPMSLEPVCLWCKLPPIKTKMCWRSTFYFHYCIIGIWTLSPHWFSLGCFATASPLASCASSDPSHFSPTRESH